MNRSGRVLLGNNIRGLIQNVRGKNRKLQLDKRQAAETRTVSTLNTYAQCYQHSNVLHASSSSSDALQKVVSSLLIIQRNVPSDTRNTYFCTEML